MIYLIYILIILLTFLLIIIIKDKKKALKLSGILTGTSGVVLLFVIFILKMIIDNYIHTINVSSITDYIFNKFIYNSLIILTIGIIEIIICNFIKSNKTI